eukprot:GFUD01047802.1.p1 GENE.GFUD01047802.1~~GFUD01047802.1.p1  ORF type:complete len:166 (+),score=37.15 GFUD01047802.1:55-552(+)
MSTPLNLYGIPFRSWLLLNQNSSWIRQAELKTNQFSSQERNQEVQRNPDPHTSFHTYFVTIVTVLSAIISAMIFMIIMWRTYKCFSRVRKNVCENHKLSALPIVDKRKMSPPLHPAVLPGPPGHSRICQEVTNTKVKTRHLPSSQHWARNQLPAGRLSGTRMDSV